MCRTHIRITRSLLLALLACHAVTGTAQEDTPTTGIADDRPGTEAAGSSTGTNAVTPAPAMSGVKGADMALTVSTELVAQAGNTVMTAGTCLVIDDLVRQFCSANPADISCQ